MCEKTFGCVGIFIELRAFRDFSACALWLAYSLYVLHVSTFLSVLCAWLLVTELRGCSILLDLNVLALTRPHGVMPVEFSFSDYLCLFLFEPLIWGSTASLFSFNVTAESDSLVMSISFYDLTMLPLE